MALQMDCLQGFFNASFYASYMFPPVEVMTRLSYVGVKLDFEHAKFLETRQRPRFDFHSYTWKCKVNKKHKLVQIPLHSKVNGLQIHNHSHCQRLKVCERLSHFIWKFYPDGYYNHRLHNAVAFSMKMCGFVSTSDEQRRVDRTDVSGAANA